MAGTRLARRKIAAYFADELIAGRNASSQLAAYLVETKRTRELILIVRDIESALAERGVLVADVASSHALVADTEKTITHYLKDKAGAKEVHIRPHVDPSLLGGVRIDVPGERLDSTIRHRLNQLTASKI